MELLPYRFAVFTIVFSAAESDREFEMPGERIYVDNATDEFTVKLNSRSADAITMKSKDPLELPFEKFYITVTGPNTITLEVSNPGTMKKDTKEVNVDEIKKLEKTADGNYDAVASAGAVTLIAAANTERKSLLIVSVGANDVYVGLDNAVTVNNGTPLLAATNGWIEITKYTGAVYGIGGGAWEVRYLEQGA